MTHLLFLQLLHFNLGSNKDITDDETTSLESLLLSEVQIYLPPLDSECHYSAAVRRQLFKNM